MKTLYPKHFRILAIAPSSKGFGFAALEGDARLVDWGVKSVKKDKNTVSLIKVKEVITHLQPEMIVLENISSKHSRRSPRIRVLHQKIMSMAESLKVKVMLFSREQVNAAFFEDGDGTKHAVAEILAMKFPEELGARLPAKRRAWEGENYRMNVFEAVALAFVARLKHDKNRQCGQKHQLL